MWETVGKEENYWRRGRGSEDVGLSRDDGSWRREAVSRSDGAWRKSKPSVDGQILSKDEKNHQKEWNSDKDEQSSWRPSEQVSMVLECPLLS